ncbi:MAG: hypothetical protein NTV22_01305 [bacterium]|nr:hypothetical protein [bacterium]
MHRSIVLLYVVVSVASAMAVKNFTCIDQQYKGNVPCDAGVYLLEHGGVLSVAGIAVGKDGSVQKAQRIAEEYARKQIADLISVTVASTTESSAQEIRIQNNDTVSTAAKEQFKQYVRSDVKALLRGVRMVANWMSDDETEALVAIAADPAAAKVASSVATSVPTALRAEGGDQVVEVTGLAALVGSNSQAARAAAMQDACKRAVVMAVGVFVDAETATKNNAALQERLYSRTDGFVKKYDVLNETIERLECRGEEYFADNWRLTGCARLSQSNVFDT